LLAIQEVDEEVLSDEIWAHGEPFTESYVTVLVEGES